MNIRKTKNKHIRRSRVPSPEIYSSISEAFCIAYADETEVPGVEVVSALGGVEVGWIAVPPGPGDLGSRLIFDRIGSCVSIPDVRFGDNIHNPMQWSGS